MQRLVALDLETVPDEALVSAVDGESGRPYPEQVQRLVAERRARTGGRTDFLPLPYHRPVVACLLEAVSASGLVTLTDASVWDDERQPEPAFLEELWPRLGGASLISFHGKGFDLPVLELRSLKHALPTPSWLSSARRTGGEHFDLREMLAGQGSSAPLDLYAKLVGLPGKGEVVGEDVQALYAAGDLERIVAYCMTDVIQTYLLFLRHQLVDGALTPDAYAESVEQAREALPRILARRLRPGERAGLDGFLKRCEPFFAAPADDGLRRAL
ncbi:MAG TPA: 3'-5' exonuclease [Anaeromyxobacter sp.]|nr:3'-5' exonuclease [Anaeromyxobacter sp.]